MITIGILSISEFSIETLWELDLGKLIPTANKGLSEYLDKRAHPLIHIHV